MSHPSIHGKAIVLGIDAAVSVLVEEFLDAGIMPNLQRLIARGVYTRIRSVFPGVTPINWASVSTGAYPGTHGITDFMVLYPGDPLDGGRDGFDADTYLADTLWQAATRAGHKVATLNYPGATPPQHPNHLWVAARGSPAATSRYEIRNTSCYATEPYASAMRDSQIITLKDSEALLHLAPDNDPNGTGPILRVVVSENAEGQPGIAVYSNNSDSQLTFLAPGQVGPWLWSDFSVNDKTIRGSYRLELTQFDPDAPALSIYVSQVTSPANIAIPSELGLALVEEFGPFIGYCGARGFDRQWVSAARMVDEGRYKGMWLARAARRLLIEDNCQLVMFKWHLIDHIQHSVWGGYDPISAWYKSDRVGEFEALIRESYDAADAMIGELLPLFDEDVTLIVVSDHGHIPHLKAISINNLLAEHDLIATFPGYEDPPAVDWSRTKAFAGPALGHIWINQKGRQPAGIVPTSEYEAIRQQVIDLLAGLRDPENGAQPIAIVMRREDAESLGLWGERVGDVVYLMSPGYSGDSNWSPLSHDREIITPVGPGNDLTAEYGEGKFIAHKFQSVHGCGDPAASLGRGSEEAILAMAGPGVRVGATLEAIPDMTAIAPTLAKLCGLPVPNNSHGKILEEWLKVKSDDGSK